MEEQDGRAMGVVVGKRKRRGRIRLSQNRVVCILLIFKEEHKYHASSVDSAVIGPRAVMNNRTNKE